MNNTRELIIDNRRHLSDLYRYIIADATSYEGEEKEMILEHAERVDIQIKRIDKWLEDYSEAGKII